MINPSYGAPVFVARLVTVSIDTNFLFKIVNLVIKLVYDNSGHVFAIMSDNIPVNQKTFKSLNFFNCTSGKKSSKFQELFTMYDLTNLCKNMRNNWVIKKTQTLSFAILKQYKNTRQSGKIQSSFMSMSKKLV